MSDKESQNGVPKEDKIDDIVEEDKEEEKVNTKVDKSGKKEYVVQPKKAKSAWIFFNVEKVSELKEKQGMAQKEAFV